MFTFFLSEASYLILFTGNLGDDGRRLHFNFDICQWRHPSVPWNICQIWAENNSIQWVSNFRGYLGLSQHNKNGVATSIAPRIVVSHWVPREDTNLQQQKPLASTTKTFE